MSEPLVLIGKNDEFKALNKSNILNYSIRGKVRYAQDKRTKTDNILNLLFNIS